MYTEPPKMHSQTTTPVEPVRSGMYTEPPSTGTPVPPTKKNRSKAEPEKFIKPLSLEAVIALIIALINLALDQADIHIVVISWISVIVCIALSIDMLRRTQWGRSTGYRSGKFISACAGFIILFSGFGVLLTMHKRSTDLSRHQVSSEELGAQATGRNADAVQALNGNAGATREVIPSATTGRNLPSIAKSPKVQRDDASQPTFRPYDLPVERRAEVLSLLKPPNKANAIRVGCLGWSERACVTAGRFLLLLSEAGWTIDENKVFRLDNTIPNESVSIVSPPEPGPPLPPHLGRWHAESLSEITLFLAFTKMGLKPNGSTDSSLTSTITGVYFGPEPHALVVDKRSVQGLQVGKFVYESKAIEKRSSEVGVDLQQETEWDAGVQDWLRMEIGEAASTRFRELRGIGAKSKFLISLAQQFNQP